MPSNCEPISGEAPELLENLSVLDFVYEDAARVGSYLAQIIPAGHLQSVKQTTAVEDIGQTEVSVNASAGVVVARGGGQFTNRAGVNTREGSEHTFDPHWANAIRLLTELDQRNMLRRDIAGASIGQFVLLSGALQVIDMGLLRSALEKKEIRDTIMAGAEQMQQIAAPSRQERRAARNDGKKTPTVAEMMFTLIGILPHTTQALITGNEFRVWCGLKRDALTTSAEYILLEHGLEIPGDWQVLGILSARPDPAAISEPSPFGTFVPPISAPDLPGPFGQLHAALASVARGLLGRGPGSYGVTPVLIFRSVSA